jgi:hypothetical protein
MTGRAFVLQLALSTALVVMLNVAIARLTVDSIPRQLLRTIAGSPPVSAVFVGNSLIAAAVDTSAYDRARAQGEGPTLNIGMGSSSPIEHDLLLRRALRLRPKHVIYGFFDTQLTEPIENRWTDLFGNRTMVFYVDPSIGLRFIAPDSRWRALEFRVLARVPMFVERASIWARVEKGRRALRDFGLRPRQVARFGQVGDFRDIEPLDPAAFRRHCASAAAEHVPLLPPVIDMLEQARQVGADTLVVEMPQAAPHRAQYYDTPEWAAYREHVKAELRRYGASYLRASDWMADAAFEDEIHLSPDGARAFSARLATIPEGRSSKER